MSNPLGGMSISDWATIGGQMLNAGAEIYGASNQSSTNAANLQAQQQHNAMIQQYVNQLMQTGQNPFASAYLRMIQGMTPPGQTPNPQSTYTNPGTPYQTPQSGPGGSGPTQNPTTTTPTDLGGYNVPQLTMPQSGQQGLMAPSAIGYASPMPRLNASAASPSYSLGFPVPGGYTPPVLGSPGTNSQPFGQLPTTTSPVGLTGGSQLPGGATGASTLSPTGVPTINPAVGSFATPSIGTFNTLTPQTYKASTLGAAPQIGGLPGVSASPIFAPTVQAPQTYSPTGISNLPAVGTQGFNAGQDGLMQAARANIQAPSSGNLLPNLNQMSSTGNAFDPSGMLNALQQNQNINLNQQVNALHASAGDLGSRFGTAMNNNEALLRTNLGAQYNQANQSLLSTTYENAQNRAAQALGTQASYQTGLNQLPFQNAQLQQQALTAAGSQFLQGQSLNLQGQQANQSTSLAAQSANQQAALQAGLAGQTLGQQNAQFNASAQMTAQQQMAAMGLQAQTTNQSASLAAQQANAGYQSQFGLANQNAMNTASQFNSQAGTQAAQFNSNQTQNYNSLLMSLLGQGQGAYTGQNQYNAGLVGILQGLAIPQQQPSPYPAAIASAGNTVSTIPILQSFLNS